MLAGAPAWCVGNAFGRDKWLRPLARGAEQTRKVGPANAAPAGAIVDRPKVFG